MNVLNFLNSDLIVWTTTGLAFLAFCIPAFPKSFLKKRRENYIKHIARKQQITAQQVKKSIGLSERDIAEMYDLYYLDLKQTFTFNFFILLATAIATKSLNTDSLLATYATTSIYIYFFNLDFFKTNHKTLYRVSLVLLIMNIFFLFFSWFKGGNFWWFLSFLSSAITIVILGFKHGVQAQIKKRESQKTTKCDKIKPKKKLMN